MKPDIETIVQDILKDTPELALEAEAIRVLVSELVAKQPTVAVDEVFRARLRAQLVSAAVVPQEKRALLPWWLVYTVPVGLTALLLLVIQPPYATAPVIPTVPEAAPSTLNTEAPEAVETGSYDAAPSMMRMETAPAMKVGGGDAMQTFETGLAEDAVEAVMPASVSEYFNAEFTPDGQAVRITHLSLAVPAFVTVSGPEGVVTVSGLFLPGEHASTLLPLSSGIRSGEVYTAVWYYDNGDEVYTEGFEALAVDWTGAPISMTFIAP